MTLIIDTGSSWIWIPDKDCPKNKCPNGIFNYSNSSTFNNTYFQWNIKYGRGNI